MDAHDLDDELLALAGEGDDLPSSPGPDESPIPNESPAPKDSPAPKESPASKGSPAPKESATPAPVPKEVKKATPPADPKSTANAVQKGVARKMNKRTAATRPTLTIESDQDEPSSGSASPASVGSAAMDESEDESPHVNPNITAPDEPVAHGPEYPLEGKFLSQRDKLEIMSLPEARREEILADRHGQVERAQFNEALRQRHEEQQRLSSNSRNKRSANAANLEHDNSQPSKKTATNSKLERYKQQREQKNERRRRDDDRRAQGRSLSARSSSSPDSDVAPAEPPSRPDGDLEVELRGADCIRLSRSDLPTICFTPGFETFAEGCFIRVAKGPDERGRMRYQAHLVKKVVTGTPYTIATPSENAMRTDQYFSVVIKDGDSGPFPFEHCSNSHITPDEWDAFKKELAKTAVQLPTRNAVDEKLQQFHALRNHRWTDEQITAKLKRAHAVRPRFAEQEKEDTARRLDQALAIGDIKAAEREQELLARLDDYAKLPQPKKQAPTENELLAQRLEAVNKEIRKSNMETVRPKPKPKAKAPPRVELSKDGEVSNGGTPAPAGAKKGGKGKREKELTEDEYITQVVLNIPVDIDIGI